MLPDDTSEECYKSAIQNFSDAIAQDGDTAEYYYLRGKAEYHNIQWDYIDSAIKKYTKKEDGSRTVKITQNSILRAEICIIIRKTIIIKPLRI